MTRIVDRYLLRELLGALGAVSAVLFLILLGGTLTVTLDRIARGKVPATLLLSQLGLRSIDALPILLPLAGAPWTRPLRGHEFHYSTLVSEGAADRLFDTLDAIGDPLPAMGLRRGKVMGSFAHIICTAP